MHKSPLESIYRIIRINNKIIIKILVLILVLLIVGETGASWQWGVMAISK